MISPGLEGMSEIFPRFGMIIADLQWLTIYKLDAERAAAELKLDGIDTVVLQNLIDPSPGGVQTSSKQSRIAGQLVAYSDERWTAALRKAGIRMVQTSSVLCDPAVLLELPDARPVNAFGEPDHGFSGRPGICPTSETYLERKIVQVRRVVEELEPDGLLFTSVHLPVNWRRWLADPSSYDFSWEDQWCFCDRCRSRFSQASAVALPGTSAGSDAATILQEHRETWIRWRSGVVATAIERIAVESGAQERRMELWCETLPIPVALFNGNDLRRTIAGQDLALLASTCDVFQVQATETASIRSSVGRNAAITDVLRILPAGRRIVGTVAINPRIASSGTSGNEDELWHSASMALASGADGLNFSSWSELLEDDAAGGRKRQTIREITGAPTSRSRD